MYFRFFYFILVIPVAGCTPTGSVSNEPDNSAPSQDLKISTVPLRILIAGRMDQVDLMKRQWLSDSEQPIDVNVLSVEELLNSPTVQADVILYPSRLLGEMLKRQWVVKLPEAIVRNRSDPERVDLADRIGGELSLKPALLAATSYNGVQYGLPLGFSMISLLGSAAVSVEELSFQDLMDRLLVPQSEADSGLDNSLELEVDADALVDRFLAIAFGVSSANPKYGVLFDVRSMKARLMAEEFLFAGNLLRRLALQNEGLESVVGSHADAWLWINQRQEEAYAMVSASSLGMAARSEDSAVTLDQAREIRLEGSRPWNDGAGLMVSITSQCRQTAQSVRFLEWIVLPRTITSLEPYLPGVVVLEGSPTRLADRVIQRNAELLGNSNLISEPRLPLAYEYRRILGNELIEIVQGAKTVEEGLSKAAGLWDEITEERGNEQKVEYERSLGMTL